MTSKVDEFLQSDLPNDITSLSKNKNRKYHNNKDNGGNGGAKESTKQTSTQGISRVPKHPNSEERKEIIEQFEPGVYVTLIQLSKGTKIFKRVRFRYFAYYQLSSLILWFLLMYFIFLLMYQVYYMLILALHMLVRFLFVLHILVCERGSKVA